jgi:ketosteroid isomerase-like protein
MKWYVVLMVSTKDVIDHHLQSFREGNIEGILADYSADAVLFTPSGILRGRSEIKTLFQALLAEFGKPGASETLHTTTFEGDYAYLVWSAETADNFYEFATDTFVVQRGKIVVQSFAAKISPKRY